MPEGAPNDPMGRYAGRHRGRHRTRAGRSSRRLGLPSAAAAALTLTATSAVVAPGLTGGTAVAETQPRPTAAPVVQGHPGSDSQDVTGERAAIRQVELAAQAAKVAQAAKAAKAAQVRAANRARASRAAARKKLVERQQAELAAVRSWVLPVASYRFTSPFGFRWGRLHAGDDFAAPVGTPVVAMSTGTVVFAGTQSGYGTKLEIRYWDGTVSWFGHLSRIDVQVGDEVTPGQLVAATGNTGQSTGPHLHLEIHPDGGAPIDPAPWLSARGIRL